MKKPIKYLGLVFVSLVVSASAEMLVFSDINKAIPDNSEFGVQDTQVVVGYGPIITSVEVYLKLSAAESDWVYNGDYYVSLQHDSGFSILLNRTGRTATHSLGYGDNGFDITFSPGGNDVHNYQTFSYTLDSGDRLSGTWGADGRNTDPNLVLDTDPRSALLDSFTGLNPNGNWTLFVADLSQNGNGVIEEWGLNIAAVPEPATLSLLFAGTLCAWFFRRVQQYIST